MTQKLNPNDPLRPRNIRKRERRQARQQHKKVMAAKREAENNDAPQQDVTDKLKVFHKSVVDAAKQRIARMKEKIALPFRIESLRRGQISRCLVINRDGCKRELLADIPDRHVILCHGRVAKVITSHMCVFTKITEHEEVNEESQQRHWIDGSWALNPCSPAMLRGTTVQHVRRRPWWFLRRYWYEISFDGRVQPAGMFYDYDIDPLRKRQAFYITHEFVKLRNKDGENDFLRFWLRKENITAFVDPKKRR